MKPALILLAALLVAVPEDAYGQDAWSRFVAQPDSVHFVELLRVARGGERCAPAAQPPAAAFARLLDHVRAGKRLALEATFLALPCVGGGSRADLHRSAGVFFDRNPRCFMRLARKHRVAPEDIEGAIVKLPPETIDQYDLMRAAIDRRLGIIESLNDSSLVSATTTLQSMRSRIPPS